LPTHGFHGAIAAAAPPLQGPVASNTGDRDHAQTAQPHLATPCRSSRLSSSPDAPLAPTPKTPLPFFCSWPTRWPCCIAVRHSEFRQTLSVRIAEISTLLFAGSPVLSAHLPFAHPPGLPFNIHSTTRFYFIYLPSTGFLFFVTRSISCLESRPRPLVCFVLYSHYFDPSPYLPLESCPAIVVSSYHYHYSSTDNLPRLPQLSTKPPHICEFHV
jgi:hypothetical protein